MKSLEICCYFKKLIKIMQLLLTVPKLSIDKVAILPAVIVHGVAVLVIIKKKIL